MSSHCSTGLLLPLGSSVSIPIILFACDRLPDPPYPLLGSITVVMSYRVARKKANGNSEVKAQPHQA
jgi:hypothetical protein